MYVIEYDYTRNCNKLKWFIKNKNQKKKNNKKC